MQIEFSALSFPELLAQRAVARIALRRGRRPMRTQAILACIERELEWRKRNRDLKADVLK